MRSGSDRFTRVDAIGGGLAGPVTGAAWTTGRKPTVVVTADFDRDRTADLAILNRDDATISVFLGDGRGGFRSKASVEPNGVATVLSAGSGADGIAVADVSGARGVRLTGTFPTGTTPSAIAVGNLMGDADGVADVVVANAGSNDVSVLVGSVRDGRWVGTPGPRLRVGAGPNAVAIRDVDFRRLTGNPDLPGADGIPDLIVTNGAAGTLTYLHGLGGGFFDDADPVVRDVSGGVPITGFALSAGSEQAFFLTSTGAVLDLGVGTGGDPRTVVAGGAVSLEAVFSASLSATLLVTGSADGTVSLREVGAGGTAITPPLTQTLDAGTPISDVTLLESGGGGVDVYLTRLDQDVPVVVPFDLTQLLPSDPGPTGGGGPVGDAPGPTPTPATPDDGGDATGIQPAAVFGADPREAGVAEGLETVAAVLRSVEGEASLAEGSPDTPRVNGQGEDEEAAEPPPPPALEQFLSGVEEALREFGWLPARPAMPTEGETKPPPMPEPPAAEPVEPPEEPEPAAGAECPELPVFAIPIDPAAEAPPVPEPMPDREPTAAWLLVALPFLIGGELSRTSDTRPRARLAVPPGEWGCG